MSGSRKHRGGVNTLVFKRYCIHKSKKLTDIGNWNILLVISPNNRLQLPFPKG